MIKILTKKQPGNSKSTYCYKTPISDDLLPSYKIAIATLGNRYDDIATMFHAKYPEPPFTWKDFVIFMKKVK